MRVFVDISKEALANRKICTNIESLVFVKELSMSLTAQEGAFLISKQGAVKEKKMRICFNIKATRLKWIQRILKTMFEFIFTQVT